MPTFEPDFPQVVTVYDMIHEIVPELFGEKDDTSPRKRVICDRAKRIIAISQSTKDDLVRIFDLPSEKIDVVRLAGGFHVDDFTFNGISLPSNYLLFIGARAHYKNFQRFVSAIASLIREQDLHIVCTGPAMTSTEIAALRELGIESRITQMSVSERQLPMLYRHAKAFVFPSLYEGFGIPLLESMSAGCPMAISDINVFREVADDCAIYFDPSSEASIESNVRQLINDAALRKRLVDQGRKRCGDFSWAKVINETKTVYLRSRLCG